MRKYRKRKRIEGGTSYRIKWNLRLRFYRALKGIRKSASAVRDLGMTIPEFKKYFETKFYPHPITGKSMTWENYGKEWHIDHVIPLASFDFSKESDQKIACHWSNLQPRLGRRKS
ncbi:MAG: hypothetical protein KGO96_07190 [Elusimicrobia bacterium]|nr:hypothetical protein [Elusimicrobiota bacterium]